MAVSRKLAVDLMAGALLSSIFCILLVKQIVAGGLGTSITLMEFLSTPENFIFCAAMASFIFASWLMRGLNNRLVLFCWAIGMLIHHTAFWSFYKYFYYYSTNIYAINLAGLISSIPLVLFLRYRVTWTSLFMQYLASAGLFTSACERYIKTAKVTDFEHRMERTLLAAFCIEFAYSLYLSLYAIAHRIPYNSSLDQHFIQHNNWDPFYFYYWLLNLISCIYVLIISFYLYRDQKNPDAKMYGTSENGHRKYALKVLEKRRAAANKNIKKA